MVYIIPWLDHISMCELFHCIYHLYKLMVFSVVFLYTYIKCSGYTVHFIMCAISAFHLHVGHCGVIIWLSPLLARIGLFWIFMVVFIFLPICIIPINVFSSSGLLTKQFIYLNLYLSWKGFFSPLNPKEGSAGCVCLGWWCYSLVSWRMSFQILLGYRGCTKETYSDEFAFLCKLVHLSWSFHYWFLSCSLRTGAIMWHEETLLWRVCGILKASWTRCPSFS